MRISDWSSDVCSSDLAPVQFVLGGPTYELLDAWSDRIVERALQNPNLLGVDKNYKPTRPEIRVEIDRNRAADLCIPVATICRTLETMLGSRAENGRASCRARVDQNG